ncbi:MAG: hypothetical protein ABI969_02085 [bacterium]
MTPPEEIIRPEPRWPAILASFAAVALHFALPERIRIGPPWTLATIVAMLVVAAAVTRRRGMWRANNVIAYSILIVLTGGLLFGVGSLIVALVLHRAEAIEVLRAAAVLWATNMIVFATWYWRLDAGGPNARERRGVHTEGAFLFPQMTFSAASDSSVTIAEEQCWRPHFVDYLFVAFNTSTAFSPTDAPVLSKWAKVTMMIQAIISFTTVVLVAARAVNILPT